MLYVKKMDKQELIDLRGKYTIEEIADMLNVSMDEIKEWEESGNIADDKYQALKEIHDDDSKLYVDYIARMEELKRGNSKGLRIWYRFPYPILVLIAFLLLGFLKDGWHPYWVLFLTVPIYYSLGSSIFKKSLAVFNYPCLMIMTYLLIGFISDLWSPAWLVFLTIPLYYEICNSIAARKISYLAFANLILIIYLTIGVTLKMWHPWWVLFLLILTCCDVLRAISYRKFLYINIYPLAIFAYILMGSLGNMWHPGWIVLLTIPVYQGIKALIIHRNRNNK